MFANIPFMDNYQLNLDWLMKKMREIQQNWAEMLGYKEDAEQAVEDAEAQATAAASSATEAAGSANSAQTQAAAAASSASAARTSASQAQANAQQALTTTPITTNYQSNATVVQQLNTLNSNIAIGDIVAENHRMEITGRSSRVYVHVFSTTATATALYQALFTSTGTLVYLSPIKTPTSGVMNVTASGGTVIVNNTATYSYNLFVYITTISGITPTYEVLEGATASVSTTNRTDLTDGQPVDMADIQPVDTADVRPVDTSDV